MFNYFMVIGECVKLKKDLLTLELDNNNKLTIKCDLLNKENIDKALGYYMTVKGKIENNKLIAQKIVFLK